MRKLLSSTFFVVLFIMLYQVIQTFECVKSVSVAFQMKVVERFFPVVQFIML